MKTLLNTLYILLLLVASITCVSQETDNNTFLINQYFQNSTSQTAISSDNYLFSQTTNNNNYNNAISEVQIMQVGNYNIAAIKTNGGDKQVSQIGNNNSFNFMPYYSSNHLNFEVQQLGSNNNLQMFGENSIMNNMKIVQFSNNKTISITNYK